MIVTADHMQLVSFLEDEPFLPDVLILQIFSHLSLQALTNYRLVARRFLKIDEKLALEKILQHMKPFGKKEWETNFGEVGEAPPLPPLNVLKEIYKTYMLVLLPKTVDGKPLTLKNFAALTTKDPICTDFVISHEVFVKYGDVSNESSRWVLFSKDLLEGTKYASYPLQEKLVKKYSAEKGGKYTVPSLLEAVVSLVLGKPKHFFTRCQERINDGFYGQVVVGQSYIADYRRYTLDVTYNFFDAQAGIAAVRNYHL